MTLVATMAAGAAALPPLEYGFSSFATPAPEKAAAFFSTYFDATTLRRDQILTAYPASAEVHGSRFYYGATNASHDVYFVKDGDGPASLMSYFSGVFFISPGPRGQGAFRPDRYYHETHRFDLEEHWDWYMDWHLCFNVDDTDTVAMRLVSDGVPIVTRAASFYVEIPDGITVQFLGGGGEYVWTEAFNFCRTTGEASLKTAPQKMQIEQFPARLPPLPEIRPGHHSFFSSTPTRGRDALVALGAAIYNTSGIFESTHRYGDGTCALLEWLQLPEFQIHFVDQYRKYEGVGRSVADVERLLEAAHGDMGAYDAYMSNRVGFGVSSLDPFRAALAGVGVQETPSTSLQHDFVRVDASHFCV
jgi:hypothetical protein